MRWKPAMMLSRALGRTALIAFTALSIWNAPALAQDAPQPAAAQVAAPDPERLALAREMLGDEKSKIRGRISQMDLLIQRTAPPENMPRFRQLVASMAAALDAFMPEMLDHDSEIYAQGLTAQEMRDTLAFSRSPSGQAIRLADAAMWNAGPLPDGLPPISSSVDPARLALAREMLDASDVKGQFQSSRARLLPDQQEILDKSMPDLLEGAAMSYASILTEQEMKDALDFYRSPSGQSLNKKMPILKEQVGAFTQSVSVKIIDAIKKDYCAHRTCDEQDQDMFAKLLSTIGELP